MLSAASSFLIYICVPPNCFTASLINLAASASASDLIICAFLSYSSLKTMNFCISASCCCTAFFSMALEYSGLNPRCMKLTSSTLTLKSLALVNNPDLISLLIVYLDLRSWSASSGCCIDYIVQRWSWVFLVRWSWILSFHIIFLIVDGCLVIFMRWVVVVFWVRCLLFVDL
jgi:hypothetical protein